MARNLGIPTKYSAKDLPKDDPRGKISAANINTMVKGIEESELAGEAQKVRDDLGDFKIDLRLSYNLAKQL